MTSVFDKKNILISGATGLIGKALVRRLAREGASVYIIVRNLELAKRLFSAFPNVQTILCDDIANVMIGDMHFDYMVHGAATTSSKAFIQTPVDIIKTNILGTIRMLELARKAEVKGFAFLSTMEVYGAPMTDERIDESYVAISDTMCVRESYPESKRMCETICASYYSQYHVPTRVLRLTQTFGPGVSYQDERIFAYFARCVIEGNDIVLRTKGETRRSYLYTEDAVDAILIALEKGVSGEAYNVANEETYCSVLNMANMVAERFGNQKVKVRIEEQDVSSLGYAPVFKMNLNTDKIQALGWKARTELEHMFDMMIADMVRQTKNPGISSLELYS